MQTKEVRAMSKMNQVPKIKSREIRYLTTKINLRSSGSSDNPQNIIEGYALKFNKPSEDLGDDWFGHIIEQIDPHALDDADMSDVRCLFNHDQNKVLGRNTISPNATGSLALSIDSIGLKFSCIPTDTSYGRDLISNIQAGVVNQCSFAFSVPDETDSDDPPINSDYDKDTDTWNTRIMHIKKLYDVSVVTTPAYPDTEAAVGERNLIKSIKEKREKIEKNKRNREILRKKLILRTFL